MEGQTQNRGNEEFTLAGVSQNFTLADFWQWQASDFLNNLTRAKLAEFIVACALRIQKNGPLQKWDPYDLNFKGKRIEVKASGYLQEWNNAAKTNPRFTIHPSKSWDKTRGYSGTAQRNCDMYIFCIHTETDRDAACKPLLDKWEFYPVLTSVINEKLGGQKTLGMGTICSLCPEPLEYASLHDEVVRLFESNNKPCQE